MAAISSLPTRPGCGLDPGGQSAPAVQPANHEHGRTSIARTSVPALAAVLAVRLRLAIAAQILLEFFAPALGDREQFGLVAKMRLHRPQRGQVLAPEPIGDLSRLERCNAKRFERLAAAAQRAFEHFELDRLDAAFSA